MNAIDRQRQKAIVRARQRRRKQAFSLTDLLMAIAIMGTLSAIGTERYGAYIAQSRRAEAYAAIDALWNAQEAFYAEHGVYNPDLRTIGFRLNQGQYVNGAPNQYQGKYYTYVVTVHPYGFQEWMVRATGNVDGDDYDDILVGGNIQTFTVN